MTVLDTIHALVVDDQRTITSHIDSSLNSFGFSNVVWTTDGESALSYFLSDADFADIVISDLTLPVMSGIELYNELQKIKPGIQFLMLLADPTRENVVAVRDLGIKHILAKPFSTEDLLDHVEAMVEALVGPLPD